MESLLEIFGKVFLFFDPKTKLILNENFLLFKPVFQTFTFFPEVSSDF
jgi:hypothetical protein